MSAEAAVMKQISKTVSITTFSGGQYSGEETVDRRLSSEGSKTLMKCKNSKDVSLRRAVS